MKRMLSPIWESVFQRRLFAVCLLLFATVSSSKVLADISYGVTGSTGFGSAQANSFYRFDTTSGGATYLGTAALEGNAFAFNATDNLYYYGDHNGSELYSYDVTTGTNTLMGNLDNFGKPAGTTLSGGADFWDGRYYYTPEISDGNLYWVSFSPDGTAISNGGSIALNLPSGITSLGDFGDIAIDPISGQLFGSSSNMAGAPDTDARFWTMYINDPAGQIKILGTTPSVYQLAFDDEGTLVGNEWMSGNIYHLNRDSGIIEFTTSTGFGGDYYDLATAGVVPEPATGIVAMILSAGLCLRRRRIG